MERLENKVLLVPQAPLVPLVATAKLVFKAPQARMARTVLME